MSKKKEKVKKYGDYTVKYESIFENESMKEIFKNFLETEHNLEPYLFLEEVECLGHIEEKDLYLLGLIEIIHKYILDGSDNEINISNETKAPILEKLKIIKEIKMEDVDKLEFKIDTILQKAVESTRGELYMDSFSRFINTTECKEFVLQSMPDDTIAVKRMNKANDFMDNIKRFCPNILKLPKKSSEHVIKKYVESLMDPNSIENYLKVDNLQEVYENVNKKNKNRSTK
jgi:hypothetical protein